MNSSSNVYKDLSGEDGIFSKGILAKQLLLSQDRALPPSSGLEITKMFDESIFANGVTLHDFDEITVNNQADKFLVEKFGKRASFACSHITLNPLVPCFGLNIYTMNAEHKQSLRIIHFNQINIVNASVMPTTIITINEPIVYEKELLLKNDKPESVLYDTNSELTSLEMAIMIKYYASKLLTNITRDLYHRIYKHFKDHRVWFVDSSKDQVVQNRYNELLVNNEQINIPSLGFYTQPLNLFGFT